MYFISGEESSFKSGLCVDLFQLVLHTRKQSMKMENNKRHYDHSLFNYSLALKYDNPGMENTQPESFRYNFPLQQTSMRSEYNEQKAVERKDSQFLQRNEEIQLSASDNKRSGRRCAVCNNHGLRVAIKYHKPYCPWRECQCAKCIVTHHRRKMGAVQVAQRRAKARDIKIFTKSCDEDMKVVKKSKTDVSPSHTQTETVCTGTFGSSSNTSKLQENLSKYESTISANNLKDPVADLMDMFKLPSEAYPIVYWILASYGGNFRQTCASIYNAKMTYRK